MRIAVVNPTKIFSPYLTYLTVGTPSYCPGGMWCDPPSLTIATKLKQMGFEIKYFDGDNAVPATPLVDLVKQIVEWSPNKVVIASETIDYYRTPQASYDNVNTIADCIKVCRDCEIILFGVHPIVDIANISNSIDIIVQGEGEEYVPEYIQTGKFKYFAGDGEFALVKDLDSLPIPDYRLLSKDVQMKCSEFAANLQGKFTQVISSRGCFQRCSFCFRGTGNKVRTRSIDSIIKELIVLKEQGFESFYFIDDYWGADREWAKELCRRMVPGKLNWTCQTKVQVLLDKELMWLMKESGCKSIGAGCESYNDDILKLVGKKQTCADIDQAVKNVKEVGIDFIAFIVLCLPGETEETIKRTEGWLWRNNFYGQGAFLAVPYPTSPLSKNFSKKLTMIEALENAGLVNTAWKDKDEVRERWRKFDKEFGKPSVIEQIKKYRPDIYRQYDNYMEEFIYRHL
jgi:hypothetical protein